MTRAFSVLALVAALCAFARPDGPPLVARVEPPNWWAGHTLNPVRLLVRGERLHGARVESSRSDLRAGEARVSANGRWAFVDVAIDPAAAAGPGGLRLVTPGGVSPLPFVLTAPLAREGRFQGFSEDDAVYLLMPDRFANGDPSNDEPARSAGLLDRAKSRFYHGGDLQGVIDRLPYLADLGFTTIWLNPVYDNADRTDPIRRYDGQPFTDYHGYGAVDFYAVDERLGDVALLRRLVDAAHARGLKVMQDQVANHTGPFHEWAGDPPTPTWLNGTRAAHLENSFDIAVLLDPRASAALRRPVLDGWFAGLLPDLNQADPDVSRYLIQNALWWVGMTGLDAIRQDTVPYVPRAFWRDWNAALAREYPALDAVGEVLDARPALVASFQKGRPDRDGVDAGFDSLFDYPLHFALRAALARGAASMREVTAVLHQDGVYPAAGRLVTLLGSHDVRRFMGEPGATVDGLKLAATLVCTTRGTPQWYYGDEIALAGGDDPDNRRDFPGGWPGDARNAFEETGRSPDEQAAFRHVRSLLHLRRAHRALRRGAVVHLDISSTSYAFARVDGDEVAIVALNSAATEAALDLGVVETGLRDGAALTDRLGGARGATVAGGRLRVVLAPRSSAVFLR